MDGLVDAHNIDVVRRISGGGTIFCDQCMSNLKL